MKHTKKMGRKWQEGLAQNRRLWVKSWGSTIHQKRPFVGGIHGLDMGRADSSAMGPAGELVS